MALPTISEWALGDAEALGAEAYIPFKSNSLPRSDRLWNKAFHYYNFNREEFLEHYHKRSNMEPTFHMIKSKFGGSVRTKTPVA